MRWLLAFLLFSNISSFAQTRKYSFSQPKMGSPLNITVYAQDSAKIYQLTQQAYQIVDSLNLIYSDYLPKSELNLLSATSGQNTFTKVSPALWDILQQCLKAAEKSNGAFDITIGRVVKLWRRTRKEKVLPEMSTLDEAIKSVGYKSIILDEKNQSVKLSKQNTLLDLGGIAKGYIAQVIVDFYRKNGFQKVLVDAGGDLAMTWEGVSGWEVGINVPDSEELLQKFLILQNQAVATSGDMYQYVELNGKYYSHIVNPKTGMGLTERKNVTIIAPDGATADWLATACSVLSVKKALKLIKSMPNCEVLIAKIKDGKILQWQSKGFQSYFQRK
jgi:FAD:protein FMN transferase